MEDTKASWIQSCPYKLYDIVDKLLRMDLNPGSAIQ